VLLEVRNLKAGYGKTTVVHGVSITVDKAEVVAIFGHNGAGKSTALKSIMGVLKPSEGDIIYNGNSIIEQSPATNVQDGITFIPQERIVFGDLTVTENLELGAYTVDSKVEVQSRLDIVNELFPILRDRQAQKANTLSGGEQRMLSLGVGLMVQPKLLLIDEPSLGLSPLLVERIMDTIREIQRTLLGTAVILVEQNLKQALRVVDRVYVMKMGRIILEESGEEFLQRGQWWGLF